MDMRHLHAVERMTLILAAIAIGGALVLLPRHGSFSVAVGAGLMAANAVVLRLVGRRAAKMAPERRAGLGILLFNVKMGALIALVWFAIRVLGVDPIPFVVGISIFPLAIVIVALRHATRISADATIPDTTESESK